MHHSDNVQTAHQKYINNKTKQDSSLSEWCKYNLSYLIVTCIKIDAQNIHRLHSQGSTS